MTGIERLHKLIADIDVSADTELWYILRDGTEGDWDCEERDGKTLSSTLAAIADQIEREQGGRVSRMLVLSVVTEMERHVSGVEGAEDSPVARWARELREALGGNGRDPAADVSVSAYDLLPQEDREAIAWVREHGGLDAVKRRWECLSYYADPVPRSCMEKRLARLQRQIDESHAALRRRNQRIKELGCRVNDLMIENTELRKRTMPEGMEWPRYDTGELVDFGDEVDRGDGDSAWVDKVVFYGDQWRLFDRYGCEINEDMMGPGERVKRTAVLASDGEPLEVGQTVWHEDGTELRVLGFKHEEDGERIVSVEYMDGPTNWSEVRSLSLTHQRPVLDADGVEVEVGDDLYTVGGMFKFHVSAIDKKSGRIATEAMFALDKWADPKMLTHRAPVLAADGRPLREGETVWLNERGSKSKLVDRGEPLKVVAFDKNGSVGVLDRDGIALGETSPWWFNPSCLTHERPDSWERVEEDAKKYPCHYFGHERNTCDGCPAHSVYGSCRPVMTSDLVRRCRALAERERGEA
ncbi:MAG TPA: hypothetical protein IAA22_05140 [Candidatus Olsenella stercoravium]|uniref:Uncharacterized protein n=1 Tax=Candidatus Olsenella stercoravium TaxID=2838713 RepID=A0A9D2DKA5_9ACTN|nr:hypothetical protein [Candidatus Olsenella stercoravium]